MSAERLTTAQALVRFLMKQHVERDGVQHRFFHGVTGIFGHGNLAGIGQALVQYKNEVPYFQARNEQAMVHMAAGFARMRNRLGAMACTSSIGPGATNMVTAAAGATINRLPVLLLPGDIFATRRAGSVLQQLESSWSQDFSVNDAFKPVSRFWDRINRPEQLPSALMEAMRVLTSPSDTGAVTLALPQDVQAEAWDFPIDLFEDRIWRIPRARPDTDALATAVAAIRSSRCPLIIAGGGVIFSDATSQLQELANNVGLPVAMTQAGKASLPFDHPLNLGPVGVSGSAQANMVARQADLVIGIGTRYTDFTTASRTLFDDPDIRFININVTEADASKHAGLMLHGDARATLEELLDGLDGHRVDDSHASDATRKSESWRQQVAAAGSPTEVNGLSQARAVRIVNEFSAPTDVVVCAAGSLPGDLHRLWNAQDPLGYHVEYGYSCMGYEVAGALGVKMADPDREVYAMVGDGSWLMMSQEVVTAVQEGLKLIVVLIDNHGFGSIQALSEALGSQGFGTRFRARDSNGQLDGPILTLDFAANARSLGAEALSASSEVELKTALETAAKADGTVVILVNVDAQGTFGGSGAWWDVPVSEVSTIESTSSAWETYVASREGQRHYL